MSLCNCVGQLNVKWDHSVFIYGSCVSIQAANKCKGCSDCQRAGRRPLIRGAETEKRERGMLLQHLRGRAARGFSRDRVLYFEVRGGTVCSTKSPNPSPFRLSLLPCLLIMFSWADSRCLSWIFRPGRDKLQGNWNEAKTLVYFQVGFRHGFMRLTSKILQLIPWRDRNALCCDCVTGSSHQVTQLCDEQRVRANNFPTDWNSSQQYR